MNGYFQIVNEETETSIMLYPAVDGGEELDMKEVASYLNQCEISYDLQSLSAAAKNMGKSPVKVALCSQKGRPRQERMKVRISRDTMSVTARFYAPSNDGTVLGKEDIIIDLKLQGVVYGVCEDVLDDFVKNREYCKDLTIALGKEKVRGQDARVEYQFNTDTKARPTLQEDGSVDFFHLNTVNNCHKGDVLARLIPAVPAESGVNVFGEVLPGGDAKSAFLRYGKNVELSEDGDEIIALVDGHVMLDEGRVSVSDVLQLKNVDHSTGNVDYYGGVHITGRVCENFTVKSGGTVIVEGVVEGAVIEAGGDVIIARGMNGMGKGKIKAGGNVIAKFFENAEVTADGYVDSDSILHSTVKAKDAVHVGGKRGFITGGRICAANGVDVKNLGSNMGADTTVEIGADPSLKNRVQDLQNLLMEGDKLIRQTRPILDSATKKIKSGAAVSDEQLSYVRELYLLYKMKKREIKSLEKELDKLQKILENSKHAAVIVRGDVYAGTRIVVGDVSMMIKGKQSYCRFVREHGDVKMKAL
ncbi:FapA family protein [Lachnospiraceae bacterium JLR.KK008]